ISELKDIELLNGDILGVLPFKDVWVGANQTTTSKKAITLIKSTAMEENLKVFPSILQSERHKQAMDSSKTLSETGYKDLENPFIQVVEDLELCVLRK
ncbi:MAG: ParA family protein, partial [Pseudanabaena sp.]